MTVTNESIPKTPDDYRPELPKDFVAPAGLRINVDDPRFKEAQKTAHARGMSQELFSDVLALEVKRVIGANRGAGTASPTPGKVPGYDTMTTQQKFALADKRNAAR
jgi:hypothetical protein